MLRYFLTIIFTNHMHDPHSHMHRQQFQFVLNDARRRYSRENEMQKNKKKNTINVKPNVMETMFSANEHKIVRHKLKLSN